MSSTTLKRVSLPSSNSSPARAHTQIRHASLLRRPHRPYQFTQLVILSDGSTYTSRTTSPLPVYRSTKDTRNHPLWQPSSSALKNLEADQAGRLRAFRKRFGRGWDLDAKTDGEDVVEGKEGEKVDAKKAEGNVIESGNESEGDSLMDLISGFAESQAKEVKKK